MSGFCLTRTILNENPDEWDCGLSLQTRQSFGTKSPKFELGSDYACW